jgi:MFS family permease
MDNGERTFSVSQGLVPAIIPDLFKRPTYNLVLPVVFMYFVVIFGIYPLATQIHIEQICNDMGESDCDSSNVSARASTLNLIASTASGVPAILTCGFYGSVADVYGRKSVLFIAFIGLTVYSATYFIVDTYNPKSYVALVIIANFIMGLCGSYITFIMGSMCYTSDATISVPHTRKVAYSYTEAVIFASEVCAPVLTGVWASYYGFFVPLLGGVIFCACGLIYICMLPESLPPDAWSRTQPLHLNPFQTFHNLLFLFQYKFNDETTKDDEDADGQGNTNTKEIDGGARIDSVVAANDSFDTETLDSAPSSSASARLHAGTPLSTRSPLPWIATAFMLLFMASMGLASVRIVYTKHAFNWDSGLIGIYDGMEGLVLSLSMAFAPAVMHRLFGRWTGQISVITWIQISYVARLVLRTV